MADVAEPITSNTTTTARKQPPPESPSWVNLRAWIVFSFWAVILCLGLPMWWQTTSIYRADLPFQEMLDWSNGAVKPLTVPIFVGLKAVDNPPHLVSSLLDGVHSMVNDDAFFDTMPVRLVWVEDPQAHQNDPLFTIHYEVSRSTFVQFENEEFTLRLRAPISEAVAKTVELLKDIFREEKLLGAQTILSHGRHSSSAQELLRSASQETLDKVWGQQAKAFKTSPSYHLTFSLFSAEGAPSSWDIQTALERQIEPLVQAISSVAEIDITSQVQLYSAFSPAVQPEPLEGRTGFLLSHNDLTAFVNAAEWPLSPSIGEGPTLNFILYVPTKEMTPLKIRDTESTSWLIPQWGGIVICNRLTDRDESGEHRLSSHLASAALSESFEIFSTQLLSLIGVPLLTNKGAVLPFYLRIHAFQRLKLLDLQLMTADSLSALARLATRLSSIPIPRHVAQLVESSMQNLTASTEFAAQGKYSKALLHARSAFLDSEKAFFDKSMVAMVHFPDEHKVAVYLPLLGPIGVPLLVALIREVRRIASRLRKTKTS